MAIFFTEGWDFGFVDPVTTIPTGWDAVAGNGSAIISAAAARSGTKGLQLGGSSTGKAIFKNFTPSISTMIVGFAVNPQNNGLINVIAFNDSGGVQVSIQISTTGQVQFFRNATVAIGPVATITIGAGVWRYFEAKVAISATVGTVELHIDGVAVIPATTGLNTKGSSTTGITQIEFIGPPNAGWFFDDIIFNDTTGAINPTFLGDVKVLGEVANANGTQNNFAQNAQAWVGATAQQIGDQLLDSNGNLQQVISVTSDAKTGANAPTWATTVGVTTVDNHVTWRVVAVAPLLNFEFVNEPVWDGDSSYLSDSTVTDQERYTFPPVSATSVFAVAAKAIMRKDDAGVRSARLVVLSNGTQADNGSDLSISSNYSVLAAVFETDPHTSAAWTVGNANAAEFGIKVTA